MESNPIHFFFNEITKKSLLCILPKAEFIFMLQKTLGEVLMGYRISA